MYIGWPTNVNKIILDSTTVTVGENAVITDSMETGGIKKRRLKCANPPDKFQVTMEFDFSKKDSNGLTELDRFYTWYKWVHEYGINPFEFPAILINSNRQEGYAQSEISSDNVPDYEHYIITSAIEGNKSGLSQQIKMTWETFSTDVISIPEETPTISRIEAENGCVKVIYTATPSTEPTSQSYTLKINTVDTLINASVFDGDVTAYVYFPLIATPGTYVAEINSFEDTFVVEG